ncbi:MAG: 3-phosphoshikimate 1-carboxyvinyltransferase, partial [Caldilineales bacterium]|nr:3-phosphoshikimate 1-carboxyvinyltransferase [Caldilineales bacterium]
ITVYGQGGEIPAQRADLFIGNAGTAARFLTAFLALGHGDYLLNGNARMQERPIGDLVDALLQLGVVIHAWPTGAPEPPRTLPIRILADGLPGGRAYLPGNISSQFLSALLMAAPYAHNDVELILTTALNSRPYVHMTLALMKTFGVNPLAEERSFRVKPARYRSPGEYRIEADASSASYFFAAAAICGGSVTVEGISTDCLQGDIAFLQILEAMGCRIEASDHAITVHAPERLRGVDADLRDIPDTAQTLAAIAPFAESPTRIRGITSARFKETDRIHAVCTELQRLGIRVEEHQDGMTIEPCHTIQPAVIQTYEDHRMAMAFSLIGLRVPGIAIANPGCVSKTFPNFFEALRR